MSLILGPATDHLIAVAATATAGLLVNTKPVKVYDGIPAEETFGMVVIGLADPLPAPAQPANATRNLFTIGMPNSYFDTVDIPGHIDVRGLPTQKAARDAAEAIFDAFHAGLAADPSMGVAATEAHISSLSGHPEVGGNAERHYRYVISFTVHVSNVTQ